MTVTYSYSSEHNIVSTAPSGEISLKDVARTFEEYVEDEQIRNGFLEVVDITKVDKFSLSSEDVGSIAQNYNQIKIKKNPIATILISSNTLQYGFSRMIKMLFELYCAEHLIYLAESPQKAEEMRAKIMG